MFSLTSPVQTWLHRLPAGLKLTLLCAATIILFAVQSVAFHALVFGAIVAGSSLAGARFLSAVLLPLRMLWLLILAMAAWHWWSAAPETAAVIVLRLVNAVMLANLVSLTTRLSAMMSVVGTVTKPLQRFGLSSRLIELVFALTIRFVPVVHQKIKTLRLAWKARSRRKGGWRLLVPITVLALDDADQVALALAARGGVRAEKET